jgi:cyclopropane-fatty-acyl-phospholipid synthase
MADRPEQKIAVESEGRHPHPMRRQLRILHVHQISDRSVAVVGDGMFTPAIYRTTITDSRQAPVRDLSEYRSYSWYVDLDDLPALPWWLRPFAQFHARDHLAGRPGKSLRDRVDALLAEHDEALPGGQVTALVQARVLGKVFNPISVFWCHDRHGVLRHVIVEVHNTDGQLHAYLLPPSSTPVLVAKEFYVPAFNPVAGQYRVLAPRPDRQLDVVVSLRDAGRPAFVARLRGARRPVTASQVLRMQIFSLLAPLTAALRIRIQAIASWMRRVPAVRPTAVREARLPAIDPQRWPAVAKAPSGLLAGATAVIGKRLLHRAANRLPLRLGYPDGAVVGAGDAASPKLVIHQTERLARRIGRHGLIGFGESYMAGEWESDSLAELLTVLATDVDHLVPSALRWLRPIVLASQPGSSRPSREEVRRNVAQHYDLSSDLFGEFLDETMTYSSAIFDTLPASWPELAGAQRRKIDRLLDEAGVGPGTRLLEIGTGWGELCIRAAARGAQVRSVTLSEKQHWLARQRVAAAGLSDRVQIELRDYDDVGGNYDAVISVELIEAIGFHAWPDYFRSLERLLAPKGRLVIQATTMPHDRMLTTRNTHTWIQKYIFPGGLIPSARAILEITEGQTDLRPVGLFSLGQHYAETLRLWRERFMQRRITLAHIGFDEVFARMWELYLAYAEAGFRSGYLNVYQWSFVSEASP